MDRYIADPLCGADATVGLFRQMLHGIAFNQNPKNLARMDSSLPVLLISGDGTGGRYGQGRPPHRRRLPQGRACRT